MSTTRSVTHLLNTTWTETFYANKFKQKSSNSLSYKHHGNKLMKITPKWKFTFLFFFCIQYKTLRTSIKLKSLTKNCPTPFSPPPLSPTIKNFQQLNSLIEIRKKFFSEGVMFNTYIHWKSHEQKTRQLTRRVHWLGKHLPSASFLENKS